MTFATFTEFEKTHKLTNLIISSIRDTLDRWRKKLSNFPKGATLK